MNANDDDQEWTLYLWITVLVSIVVLFGICGGWLISMVWD